MKKIIIAIDYNPAAEKVAEAGHAIARSLNAPVVLVHVIAEPAFYAMEYSPVMGYQGAYTEGTAEVVEEIKKEAEAFLASSVKHLGDDSIQTAVLDGKIDEAIIQYAKEQKADLIIMGSHRHSGIDRLFLSDVAVNVLRHSPIPLLTIPTGDN